GYESDRILVGLLISIDADAHVILVHPLDKRRFIFDRLCDGIEPAIVNPAVSGRSRGDLNEFLDYESTVLILEIYKNLARDRRRDAFGNTKPRRHLGHEGIKVAIGKPRRPAVNCPKSSFRPIFLEFFLHAPDHRRRFSPGAELGSTRRERGR